MEGLGAAAPARRARPGHLGGQDVAPVVRAVRTGRRNLRYRNRGQAVKWSGAIFTGSDISHQDEQAAGTAAGYSPRRLSSPGSCSPPLHPLLSWWALLFALSMLARYESASWIGHLDIDASPDAIKLRTALDLALDTCPQLVLAAIRAVSR
jgi:hypothetical protein